VTFALLLALSACKTQFDLSPAAYAAGDWTLVGALSDGPCKSLPVGGADLCRFKDGAGVESILRLFIPNTKGLSRENKISGEAVVYYRDFSKAYPIPADAKTLDIDLKDFVGPTWEKTDGDVMTTLATLKFTDSESVERTVQAEHVAQLIVLSKDYDPLPLDSGSQNWGTTCEIQYSTSGRSVVSCK